MTTIPELSPVEAAARIDELDVVDVRAAHEFDGPLGHVGGARWIPLAELAARVDELRSTRPLLLVCRSGARSRKACEILGALDVFPAVNLAGGMIAWNDAGLPIEQSEPESLAALVDAVVSWVAQVGRCERDAVLEALYAQLSAAAVEPWTHARVARALELVEAWFRRDEAPPDLDLSLAAFRRWLAVV